MEHNNHPVKSSEKSRMRDEIDAQIRDYLQRGGKIDVLTASERTHRAATGPVWDIDDLPDLDR